MKHPVCWACNDTGAVRGPGGVDACPECAARAELTWRLAQAETERLANSGVARRPRVFLIESKAA